MSVGGYGLVGGVLIVLCGATALAGDRGRSLQQLHDEANKLRERPEMVEKAAGVYRSIVETHLANEKVFQSALRELVQCYEDANQPEEAIGFLLRLAYRSEAKGRQDSLKEIFAKLQLKHPEAVKKVVEEIQMASAHKREFVTVVPTRSLVDAIVQRRDRELRQKSLEKLQEMLAAESSVEDKRSGLATLRSSLTAKFDRKPFRMLVLPLLQSKDAQTRMLAVRCLPSLEATASDLELIAPMAQDSSSEVRQSIGGALISIGKGDHDDVVIPALTRLLKDSDSKVIERTLRSMWGQYSSPEFDKLLIKLSHDPKHHGHAIYHALSTMKSKSPAVCKRLVEELDEPNWNNSGRGAWGLTYGVTDAAKPIVEAGLLKALPEETNDYTRSQEFRALRGVATEKSRPYLQSVVKSDTETEKFKEMAREILADLDKK